jgi:glycine dehydrogenase
MSNTHSSLLDLIQEDQSAFVRRHIGPSPESRDAMLEAVGAPDLDTFVSQTIPRQLRTERPYALPRTATEERILSRLRERADQNQVFRSFIGAGYHGTRTPAVIKRKILENPSWYTQYTPYQPELAQGRLEALLNFQTMIIELTGLDVANASLLDEGTAAAEAMTLCKRVHRGGSERMRFFVSEDCHPQTIAVVQTRAEAFGYEVVVGDHENTPLDESYFGALLQYPGTTGALRDYSGFAERAHEVGAGVVAACDPLALTLATPPGEFGADIAVGNTQRFGVPMGYGGPHAAYIAVRDRYKRKLPGRLVGVSKDRDGNTALRLALQTREQHIRRDAATSNICTAQVLLAVMASFYAVYHGPEGLKKIAERIHLEAESLRDGLNRLGFRCMQEPVFDTVTVLALEPAVEQSLRHETHRRGINLRHFGDGRVGIALDETTGSGDVERILASFAQARSTAQQEISAQGDGDERVAVHELFAASRSSLTPELTRSSSFLDDEVFHAYRSETELLRYIQRLESRDLSLVHSMIPLGSCTMKLNAAAEMEALTWPEFAEIHPFAPAEQVGGYLRLISELEEWLCDMTGFTAVSFQPNSGAQGEYTGLLTIRAYHRSRGEPERDVCLVPESAHGTNPASAVMAGMRVVVVSCDRDGNIDMDDLRAKVKEHAERLAGIMVTYPSTHGVFEESIRDLCDTIHEAGGQVYLDGANLNALLGHVRAAELGADVCHLNLHKTFAIPHGGGGPGMGPICVAEQLVPFLPAHPFDPRTDAHQSSGAQRVGAVGSAPFGSASILTISYAYVALMGEQGLRSATEHALLNANYIASRLEEAFPILYRGRNGRVAHECIVDLRPLKHEAGIEAEDVAKRLADYGFHAPTMSWPVAGTLMIEPTESESKEELDRFCDAMLCIREEIRAIAAGEADAEDNPLKNAPHTVDQLTGEEWPHAYSRETAVYPLPWTRERKFWPAVSRIDNVYGDRHFVCTCAPLSAYQTELVESR